MSSDYPYLGIGWSFPPEFSNGGKELSMSSGVQDVHESLQILLGTRLNERILRSGYGCDISNYAFEPLSNAFVKGLGSLIRQAILDYEPRVRIDGIEVIPNSEIDARIDINLTYRIHKTNSRFNMVYPFYINEAIQAPVSR